MASRIPPLPRDSHVQSHAAVHKNELCDSHAHLGARAIAGGWTRPLPPGDEHQLMGNLPEGSRLGMRLAGPCADESDARGIRLC
jgi:hypothetical protein